MVTLTLLSLLNFMAGDFCSSRARGVDTVKAVLISYGKAVDKYGAANVNRVVEKSPGLQAAAVATVLTKCPTSI